MTTLQAAIDYIQTNPDTADAYLDANPVNDPAHEILTGQVQAAQIDTSDITNGNTMTMYSNPSQPYPVDPAAGGNPNLDTVQLLIYNDPRAALQTLNDLGLSALG